MTVITFKRNFSRMDSVWKLITQSSSRSSLYYLRSLYTSHSSLRYDAPLDTRRPLFNCHSVQRHSVTAVSLNRYNIIKATQDDSNNARNQQTNATIIGAYSVGTTHAPRRHFCHHHCFAQSDGIEVPAIKHNTVDSLWYILHEVAFPVGRTHLAHRVWG